MNSVGFFVSSSDIKSVCQLFTQSERPGYDALLSVKQKRMLFACASDLVNNSTVNKI